jgi:hypothetical protein
MNLHGSREQTIRDHYYRADGTIAASNTSQLLLPERKSTSFLILANNSNATLWFEIGGARATATISGGGLASFAITNGGFGYQVPPIVRLYGGGNGGNPVCPGVGLYGWPAPGDAGFTQPRMGSPTARQGIAHAVLTLGVLTSIEIEDPGSGYVVAPQVFLENAILDPFGCADPYFGSANSGFQLVAGGSYYVNGTHCPTDAIAIWGATMGQSYACAWAP